MTELTKDTLKVGMIILNTLDKDVVLINEIEGNNVTITLLDDPLNFWTHHNAKVGDTFIDTAVGITGLSGHSKELPGYNTPLWKAING